MKQKKWIIVSMILFVLLSSISASGKGEDVINSKSIKLLLISHPFVESIKPLVPQFEKEYGINVEMEVLAEQPAFEKLLADLSSKTGTYDLFMTSPLQNWQYISAGWVEPLDNYINDPNKTTASFDFDDFIPGIVNAGRWTKETLKGVGVGPLWALPINNEGYMLSYRPSVLKKYNLTVPQTYDDLIKTISILNSKTEIKNGSMFPIITRFDKYWDLTYLTFANMLQSYGVELLDSAGKIAINSQASVRATEDFIKIIKTGSPPGAGSFTWYEALQGFASGQYVFSLNEADQFAAVYEDTTQSSIANDVGYAMIPVGPSGYRKSAVWVWLMSMNSASKNKDNAWKFLQWVTSKDIMIKSHLNGNMNPVRKSAWADPEVSNMVSSWGEYKGQYINIIQEMSKVSGLRFPPHPELTRILDIWAEAIQKTYFGIGSAQENLNEAAKRIVKIL